jgi:hypothetical protein
VNGEAKLKESMLLGRVYRREDLARFSKAVDRDLKTLLESGEIRKLAWGLYSLSAPDERELIRAFLKTEDFSLDGHCVRNRKRAGRFLLGGRRYEFRVVRNVTPLRVVSRRDDLSDRDFWLGRPPEERVAAVEFLREQYYALSAFKSLPRLAHSIQVRERSD